MKKHYLILTFFVLLIINGCAGLTSRTGSDGPLTGSPNGVEIKFLPEQPPLELFEGSDVIVGLELENNAACDAIGSVCINDLAPSSRGGVIEPICNSLNIAGARTENNKPSIEKDEFYTRIPSYTGIDRPEGLPVTLEAIATYNCKIIAGPQLCVKSTIGQDTSCPNAETITGTRLRASVGPITITEIKKTFAPESGGVRLVTDITLSKMNQGYISNQESIQKNR